ncbi:putative glucan endo-1,3-beta-glucosidase eglC [Trichoderma ghanense]|uniref:Probable glucan endo-1,3-beta-glucosidase eglC n=1 Tax=Trichoderma ghanense TaxID=65468 RepID=A0ABY2GVA1_9HYPO
MPSSSTLLALATAISAVNAAYTGFNYGSTFTNGQPKAQTDFEAEFKTAAGLDGTDGAFTSARLYTMIQAGTANSPISAIPAALSTKTSLLLGLWASGGDAAFANEMAALKSTISQYCDQQLGDLVAGISVGSEDLYRITPTGIASHAGDGAQPGTLVNYISQVRAAIKGSCLADVPVGHVDTWNAWVLDSNKPVVDAVDWLGMDTYPYYEDTNQNSIANAKSLYQAALTKIQNAGPGKPVWVTETGWPVNGPKSGAAVASTANAREYWLQVGCPNFGKVNVWWYTLQDAAPDAPNPSFGVIGSQLTEKPLYDLSCKDLDTKPEQPSTTSAAASETSTAAAASSTEEASTTTETAAAAASTTTTTTVVSEVQTTAVESQTTAVETVTTGSGQTTVSEVQTTVQATSFPAITAPTSVVVIVPTTFASAPFPSSNSSATGGGSPSASAPGSSPSSPSTSNIPGSSGSKLSSFGAAAAAVAVAAIAL